MRAVDTNILMYAHDPRDARKQEIALALIESLTDGALLWQVACEYLSASHKLAPFGYDRASAWQDIRDMRFVWKTILPVWQVQEIAEDLMRRYSLSFWDAMVIAACLAGGVERLYSEDFDAYPSIDGLEVVNPFAS
ncbi:MAG: PIN domain-containing protein [Anaerolineae bacterium]|nr:PIN domain-containing protein [Anaerolineae bacterium]